MRHNSQQTRAHFGWSMVTFKNGNNDPYTHSFPPSPCSFTNPGMRRHRSTPPHGQETAGPSYHDREADEEFYNPLLFPTISPSASAIPVVNDWVNPFAPDATLPQGHYAQPNYGSPYHGVDPRAPAMQDQFQYYLPPQPANVAPVPQWQPYQQLASDHQQPTGGYQQLASAHQQPAGRHRQPAQQLPGRHRQQAAG
ncbi:hypothetical protein BD626DRAFT_566097 [Schizophyllum amplum]|uniref:Uncharacterized protein n=1 Tax=Schizophyllum amplum TaxID=97359 RepID=A0A550CQH4_9AGAR|nr:hypothetical protein BD626DRAFT_566097 [Auriculariopsis ampla]